MILAGTGHRPDKLGYTKYVADALQRLALSHLLRLKPDICISGLALGWDTALALACLDANIPLVAAVPFVGQEQRWPSTDQTLYRRILARAVRVEIVCSGGYSPEKFQRRNKFMVDHCNHLLALWNGTAGGTWNCLTYAARVGRPFDNLWQEWIAPAKSHGI